MGICSYCLQYQSVDDECSSWDEARRCGITGANDPKRLIRAIKMKKDDLLESIKEEEAFESSIAGKRASFKECQQKILDDIVSFNSLMKGNSE